MASASSVMLFVSLGIMWVNHAPTKIKSARLEAEYFVQCSSSQMPLSTLCKWPNDDFDAAAYERLKSLIHKESDRLDVVCAVDAAIVQAERECPPSEQGEKMKLAELMFRLAPHWAEHARPDRAEQLFETADALMRDLGDHPMKRELWRVWARFAENEGNLQRAKELTERVTAGERRAYEKYHDVWMTGLIEALGDEASVLERLGLAEAARARIREAEALARLPNEPKVCHGSREGKRICRPKIPGEQVHMIYVCDQSVSGKPVCWWDEAL
jgi:hypothetical protein